MILQFELDYSKQLVSCISLLTLFTMELEFGKIGKWTLGRY